MNTDEARDMLWDEARHGPMHPSRRQALEILLDEHDRLRAGEGAARIAEERRRQVRAEGWTPEHDDEHSNGELAWAAVCYAAPPPLRVARWDLQDLPGGRFAGRFIDPWPWAKEWDKRPHPGAPVAARIRALEKAGALIAAEIDRLLRAAPEGKP